MQCWRSRACLCACMCACINKKNFSFNKCFMRHGMWKIPGKIRFIWPSERRTEEETAWKWVLWVLLSQCLSLPHCKNIQNRNPPLVARPMYTFWYTGGVGDSPAVGDYCDWYFFQCAPSILLFFSFSCQTVTLSSVRANYYGNEWNGYQIFFLLHFTHPHVCWCLHLLVSVEMRFLSLSSWFSWQPSLFLIPICIQTIISDTSLCFF